MNFLKKKVDQFKFLRFFVMDLSFSTNVYVQKGFKVMRKISFQKYQFSKIFERVNNKIDLDKYKCK